MTAIEPNQSTFTRNTLPAREELIRLIKSAQRHGQVHIKRKGECAEPPKHKLKIVANLFSQNC